MQQTEKYKLDLIETGDPFSPDALNANAQKLEGELARVDGERDALDGRVVKLENCRVLLGTYDGSGADEGQIIDLGERPVAVLSSLMYGRTYVALLMGENEASYNSYKAMRLTDNGFWAGGALDQPRHTFCFLAFFGDWPTVAFPIAQT